MKTSYKITLSLLALASTSILPQQKVSGNHPTISDLPAITLQMHNRGTFHSKHIKIFTEEDYGVWIAINHKNNGIHYKILQNTDDNSSFINIDTYRIKIEEFISENKDTIIEYIKDIVDIQKAKECIEILEKEMYGAPIPTLADINASLLQACYNPSVSYNKTYGTAELSKEVDKAKESFRHTIKIWQNKFDITDDNVQEIENLYQSITGHINAHPIHQMHQSNELCDYNYAWDSFSLSLNQAPSYSYSSPTESGNFYTLHFAEIANTISKTINSETNSFARYDSKVNAFVYLPPNKEQYGDDNAINDFRLRINKALKTISKHKANLLLKNNANEKIKDVVNESISRISNEIKKAQVKINHEIDKICNKLKNMFE